MHHIITLPWPPTVNTYWRHIAIRGKPRTLISKEGREYSDTVADLILSLGMNLRLIGRLEVTIMASPPDRRARDIDNLSKSLLDSMTKAGVWLDDSQIDRLTIARHPVIPGGQVTVMITEIP